MTELLLLIEMVDWVLDVTACGVADDDHIRPTPPCSQNTPLIMKIFYTENKQYSYWLGRSLAHTLVFYFRSRRIHRLTLLLAFIHVAVCFVDRRRCHCFIFITFTFIREFFGWFSDDANGVKERPKTKCKNEKHFACQRDDDDDDEFAVFDVFGSRIALDI